MGGSYEPAGGAPSGLALRLALGNPAVRVALAACAMLATVILARLAAGGEGEVSRRGALQTWPITLH